MALEASEARVDTNGWTEIVIDCWIRSRARRGGGRMRHGRGWSPGNFLKFGSTTRIVAVGFSSSRCTYLRGRECTSLFSRSGHSHSILTQGNRSIKAARILTVSVKRRTIGARDFVAKRGFTEELACGREELP